MAWDTQETSQQRVFSAISTLEFKEDKHVPLRQRCKTQIHSWSTFIFTENIFILVDQTNFDKEPRSFTST